MFVNKRNFNKIIGILMPIILVLLNFVVKGWFLSANSLGGDEPFSVYHAQMNLSNIIDILVKGNNPPLYEILLHYWMYLFGISEFSVRMPSLVFSSLTVFIIFITGVRFLNKRVAITTSLIFIFSTFHVAFAHEARVYPLFVMLTVLSMYLFMKLLSQREWSTVLFLAIVNLLLVYSHYFGLIVIGVQLLFYLIKRKTYVNLMKYIAIYFAMFIIGLLPLIRIIILRFFDSSVNGTWLSPPNGLEDIYNMLWQFSNAPVVTIVALAIIVTALIKYFVQKRKTYSNWNILIIIWFIVPFIFMFGISYLIPMFIGRYLIFVSVAYYFVLAISADYLIESKKLKLIPSIVIVVLFVATVNPDVGNKRNMRDTVAKIKELDSEKTAVIVSPTHLIFNFLYYYDREAFVNVGSYSSYTEPVDILISKDVYFINSLNDARIMEYPRVIFFDAASNFSHPGNNIYPTLEKNCDLIEKYHVDELFDVYFFNKK